MTRRAAFRLAVAAGSGAGLSLAWHPADLGGLAWVALAPLLVLAVLDRGHGFPRECFVFGFVFMSVGCAWVYQLTAAGGALMALGVATLFFLPLGWTLRTALRPRRLPLLLVAPVVWTAFEWLRSWVATGYPWLLLAHSQWSRPGLIRISAWTGAYGLSFAVAAVNAAIATLVLARWPDARPGGDGSRRAAPPVLRFSPPRRSWWLVPVGALAAVGAAAFTPAPAPAGPPLRLAVIQGNVPQRLKEEALREGRESADAVFARHLELTARAVADARARWGAPPDLVVWPETMVPGEVAPGDPAWEEAFREIAETAGAPALVGALARRTADRDDRDVYNAALLIDRSGRIAGRYDKVHLVPGGEYIPLRGILPRSVLEPLGRWIRNLAGFLPSLAEGERVAPVAVPGTDRRVGPLVCYEVIYPALAREHVREGADVLINLTNYGWFRESAQLDQALAITIFRAVETGRVAVVAANTGISAVLGPDGRIDAVLERGGRRKSLAGWLLAEVPVPAAGATPYVVAGDVLAWSCSLLSALLILAGIRGRMKRR